MDNSLIRHKGIEHGIVTDAPFVGARICAITCKRICKGCINNHMLIESAQTDTLHDVLDEIKCNTLNQGIILGGLEWSEQPEELLLLTFGALGKGLKVIIYTHLGLMEFLEKFPALLGKDVLVKCGNYVKAFPGYFDTEYDVYLASSNQKIYNLAGR